MIHRTKWGWVLLRLVISLFKFSCEVRENPVISDFRLSILMMSIKSVSMVESSDLDGAFSLKITPWDASPEMQFLPQYLPSPLEWPGVAHINKLTHDAFYCGQVLSVFLPPGHPYTITRPSPSHTRWLHFLLLNPLGFPNKKIQACTTFGLFSYKYGSPFPIISMFRA